MSKMHLIEIKPGDRAVGVPIEECRIGHPEIMKAADDTSMVGKEFIILTITEMHMPLVGVVPVATVVPKSPIYEGYCAGCFRKLEDAKFEEPRRVGERVPVDA